MAKQGGQRTRKSKSADKPIARKPAVRKARPEGPTSARVVSQAAVPAISARAEIARTIAELNEVRMRLDAIVRKLLQSTGPTTNHRAAASDLEMLRLRLLGKLDRIREKLVVRLAEERTAKTR